MISIEVLLTETELATQFLAALRERYLPEKFFYWFPLSVKAWLDLCRPQTDATRAQGMSYRNYDRSFNLVSQHASRIASEFRRGSSLCGAEVVSLGAGQGDKDVLLLEALRANGCDVLYRPVDASQTLLEQALAGAANRGFEACGLKADVASPATAEQLLEARSCTNDGNGDARLYLVLGNSLGVIDPLEFLRILRGLARPLDRVLFDGEIFSPQATMAGYDNPVNRRFAFSPLASVGLQEGLDGSLIFEAKADPRADGLHLVSKHFLTARALDIVLAGERLAFQAGEKIAMNSSYKFSHEAFLRILRESGFILQEEFLSEDERFVMVLAGPGAR